MSGARRVEVRDVASPLPASLAEAREREARLLLLNEQLHAQRHRRVAEYERVRADLKALRAWIASHGGGGKPARGPGPALSDFAAFAVVALDELGDEAALPRLAARLQAEALGMLPDGFVDAWARDKLAGKLADCEADDDAPDVPDAPAGEPAVVRCFGRLRAGCRRRHLALPGPPGPVCACGAPRGGPAPPACAALAALAALPDPGSDRWLAAARDVARALDPAGGSAAPDSL